MAVNFVAVGDGFCVTAERSVDPRHSTRAAAERLSAVGALGEQELIFCSLSVQNIHDESPLDCQQLEDHHHGHWPNTLAEFSKSFNISFSRGR